MTLGFQDPLGASSIFWVSRQLLEISEQILRRCILWGVVQGCLSLMVASTSVLWFRVTASQDLL
jgi:hypothetical protein